MNDWNQDSSMHPVNATHLIRWRVVRVVRRHSASPFRVLARSRDLEHYRGHLLLEYAHRDGPSGIPGPCVEPHSMVASLKRLDPPTDEDFQQVNTGDPPPDNIRECLDQRLDVIPLGFREGELLGWSRAV